MPRNNTSRHGPFWAYYEDDYNRALARDLFAADFKAFGYSTDVPSAELMVLPRRVA